MSDVCLPVKSHSAEKSREAFDQMIFFSIKSRAEKLVVPQVLRKLSSVYKTNKTAKGVTLKTQKTTENGTLSENFIIDK